MVDTVLALEVHSRSLWNTGGGGGKLRRKETQGRMIDAVSSVIQSDAGQQSSIPPDPAESETVSWRSSALLSHAVGRQEGYVVREDTRPRVRWV